jgi:hypothetical protein
VNKSLAEPILCGRLSSPQWFLPLFTSRMKWHFRRPQPQMLQKTICR